MLARLALEPGEEEFYSDQLSSILEHIDRLQQLDTDAIPPTAQVVNFESIKKSGLATLMALIVTAPFRRGLNRCTR